MEIYEPGTKSSFASWRGDENYTLAQKFSIKDRFEGVAEYRLTYLKSIVDGGFRQEVKGVQKEITEVGHLPGTIPPLNLPKQPTFWD